MHMFPPPLPSCFAVLPSLHSFESLTWPWHQPLLTMNHCQFFLSTDNSIALPTQVHPHACRPAAALHHHSRMHAADPRLLVILLVDLVSSTTLRRAAVRPYTRNYDHTMTWPRTPRVHAVHKSFTRPARGCVLECFALSAVPGGAGPLSLSPYSTRMLRSLDCTCDMQA